MAEQSGFDYLRDKFKSEALPFVRGFGEGKTAGLIKYPAAMVMMGLDKAVGEGKMTWNDAKDAINQQRKDDADNHAIAYLSGNVAGSVGGIPGGGVATAAGKVLQRIGPVGQGAIQGYTQNENLGDAATGAAIGGAAHVIGGAVKMVGQGAKNAYVTNRAAGEAVKTLPDGTEVALNAAERAKLLESEIAKPALSKIGEILQGMPIAAKHAYRAVSEEIPSTIGWAGTGAGAGYLASLYGPNTGLTPEDSMKLGATGAVLAAKAKGIKYLGDEAYSTLGNAVTHFPSLLDAPGIAAKTVANVEVPSVVRTRPSKPSIDDLLEGMDKSSQRESSGTVTEPRPALDDLLANMPK